MSAAASTRTIRFRGTPGDLAAAVSHAGRIPGRLPVRIILDPDDKEGYVAQAIRLEDDLVLQMTVPARTPPGTYRASIEVDGETQSAEVIVEPEIEVQIVPDQLTFQAAPGRHVPVDLTIANAGNVAFELRKANAFGVFASGGLERALHRAYTDKRPDGERRIDYLGERLAEEHGGVVRVAVEEGAGMIEPGEARDVRFNFHVPSNLTVGRTYTGTLPIHDLRYYVRMIILEGSEPTPSEPKVR